MRVGFPAIAWYRLSGEEAMVGEHLRDDQWERIKELLPGQAGERGVMAKDHRKYVGAVPWSAHGLAWRGLPPEAWPWASGHVRYSRWCHKGHWARLVVAIRQAGRSWGDRHDATARPPGITACIGIRIATWWSACFRSAGTAAASQSPTWPCSLSPPPSYGSIENGPRQPPKPRD